MLTKELQTMTKYDLSQGLSEVKQFIIMSMKAVKPDMIIYHKNPQPHRKNKILLQFNSAQWQSN